MQYDTVGQFTGLYDKDGKEIYEGDMVRDFIDAEKYLIEYIGCKFYCVENGRLYRLYDIIDDVCPVVIGNIHDNTELLK